MPIIRFSIRSLAIAISGAALLCAAPAYHVANIRAEAIAALVIENAAETDAEERNHGQRGNVVSRSFPPGRIRRALYEVAGSLGEVTRIDILGDRSALAVLNNAGAFRHVQHLRVLTGEDIGAPKTDVHTITQTQINAVAMLPSTDWLQFSGALAPDVKLAPLLRLMKLTRFELESSCLSPEVVSQVAQIKADFIRVYSDYYYDGQCPLPRDAFISFASSSCKELEIWGGLDDRVLELVASAPYLQQLELWCLPGPVGAPAIGITDDGLRRACKKLHVWWLKIDGSCQLTDNCVDAVAEIKELKRVELAGISAKGRRRLRELRPDLD